MEASAYEITADALVCLSLGHVGSIGSIVSKTTLMGGVIFSTVVMALNWSGTGRGLILGNTGEGEGVVSHGSITPCGWMRERGLSIHNVDARVKISARNMQIIISRERSGCAGGIAGAGNDLGHKRNCFSSTTSDCHGLKHGMRQSAGGIEIHHFSFIL